VRKKTPDSIVATFNETIDSTTLPTAFAEYTFTLSNPYTIQRDDRVMIEYSGPAAVQIEIWTTDKFDGSATGRVRYDTTYVNGLNEDVAGTMSSIAPVGGDTTAPSKVIGLSVSPVSGSQLNLSWSGNPEPDVAHYNIYRGTTAGFAVNTAIDTPLVQPVANSYSDANGLNESTTYYYRVAAVDSAGNIGIVSDEKFGTTLDSAAPSQVIGVTVTTVSFNQLDIAWSSNPEPDVAHYNIYRGTTGGFSVNTAADTPIAQPTTNTYSDNNGLNESTTYYYKIAAVDTSGNIGVLSEESSGTTLAASGDTTPPSKVIGVVVTPINSSSIDLTWQANIEPDLSNYNVYRSTTSGFSVTTSTIPLAQPATNIYSDVGLSESTTYYYKVAAVDTAGNIGNVSDEKSGTTPIRIFYNVPIPGNVAAGAGLHSSLSIRYGIEVNTSASLLVGKSLKSWKVRLKKSNTPSGLVTAKIRRRSDDSVVATFNETIDSTTLGTAFAEYTFTLSTPYTIQFGDKILIEYGGPQTVSIDIWNIDKFDGSNTRRTRYLTGYVPTNTEDVAGTMSTD
jgi:fibronectin type 3 domain-containing protein